MAGLVAARRLAEQGLTVRLFEAGDRVGGKLRAADVAGCRVDTGAEAMLARRPEAVALARELGLPIVTPEPVSPSVYSRGALRPLPRTVMGAPIDADSLRDSGVLSPEGLERALAEVSLPPELPSGDVSVGELIAGRFGDEVVDRLVEPLLGGVYAGNARRISARAAVPQLLAALQRGRLLQRTDPAPAPSVSATADSVFAGIEGGMWRLPEALALSPGVTVSTHRMVRRVTALPGGGFALLVATVGQRPEETVTADLVVLATPALPTSRLLRELAPGAARELAEIDAASVAVVTLAVTPESAGELPGSGFLVPPVETEAPIKAATFSANKWAWVARAGREADPGVVLLRASWGRAGDVESLRSSNAELVEGSRIALARILGRSLDVVADHVQRWGGGLPQYAVGHPEVVARVRAEVADVAGLAVCGATYDGVGIPAVIASAERAVSALVH